MDSLSTVGTWIGAALASSTQLKPPAAVPARAAEVWRNLRRSNNVFMGHLRHGGIRGARGSQLNLGTGQLFHTPIAEARASGSRVGFCLVGNNSMTSPISGPA